MKQPGDIKDNVVRSHIEDLQRDLQGKSLELSSAPTATDPLLLDGETGFYGGLYYKRIGNLIYSFTPTSTITIT